MSVSLLTLGKTENFGDLLIMVEMQQAAPLRRKPSDRQRGAWCQQLVTAAFACSVAHGAQIERSLVDLSFLSLSFVCEVLSLQ